MATINSLTSTSSSSAYGVTSKGIGGLASGLDTDEIIKGMTIGTRAKIAKQLQSKQLLSWQTDAYRNVSNKLIDFSKKYTSYTSSTNLLSSSFYTKTDITATGTNASKVSVSGSSTMTDSISILSATRASVGGAVSSGSASAQVLSGDVVDFAGTSVSSISGSTMSFKYNGQDYSVAFDGTKYADNAEFVAAVNAKLAEIDVVDGGGKKLSDVIDFSLASDKISVNAKEDGANFEISEFSSALKAATGFDASQFTDGKLTVSFGTAAEGQNATGALTTSKSFADILAGKNISFSLNSTARGISFTKEELEAANDAQKLADLFQSKLDSAFGKDSVKATVSAGGALEFRTSNSGSVLKVSDIHADAQGVLGLAKGDSNRLDLNAAITLPADPTVLSFGGPSIDLDSVTTTAGLIEAINSSNSNVTVSYIESLDRFEFKTDETSNVSMSGNVAEKFFGVASGGLLDIKASTKAQLTIQYGDGNNITLESSNNTFNIDGLTVNVNETFAAGDAVRLSAQTDTDKVFNAIKDMVKDYNDMVDLVNNEYSTKRNRSYPPLTDEQKEEMTESEIKVWEEKAKTGMLFGNSDMSALSRELRTAFFSSGENMAALNEIGITSSSNWKDNGKIVIDEDKLKKAIEEDPANIKEQFSDGVMTRLKGITDKYAKTEGSTKGILIEKAGNIAAPLSLTKNTLLDSMNSIDKTVSNLKRTLSAEQNRYYKQFSNLETVISNLNMQSGWLAQQFG